MRIRLISANNIVLIKEYKESPRFRVVDKCIEGCGGFEIGTSETLEGSVKIANKYQEEEIVEYGVSIRLLED